MGSSLTTGVLFWWVVGLPPPRPSLFVGLFVSFWSHFHFIRNGEQGEGEKWAPRLDWRLGGFFWRGRKYRGIAVEGETNNGMNRWATRLGMLRGTERP
ncbi:hypothetical protein QBC39DRAFT_343950 [Podospora conica]|nr:hypothetical protein QBC39DRAFT_343950 [Schizothecium conicum]